VSDQKQQPSNTVMAEPTIEISADGLGYREMNDAPSWYSADEASAWASGWNAAVAAFDELRAKASSLQGFSNFLDRIEGKS
jgi:hypothetical protein